jgi:dienelactone hydrolase
MFRALLFIIISFFYDQVGAQNPSANTDRKNYDSLYWIHVTTDSGIIHAAVAFPKGSGPFPAAIILHGTHGFAQEYINIAKRLADNGIVGIAACWFRGRKGAGERFITPIDFPDAPPLVDVPGLERRFQIAMTSIDSLVGRVIHLPEVQKNHLALVGHSRGGGAALLYILSHPGKANALILNSTGYPPEVVKRSVDLNVPILILHGTADDPADGGSAFTSIDTVRQFVTQLRNSKKDVEVKYYEGSGHNALFSNASQFNDTVQKISEFLQKKLAK